MLAVTEYGGHGRDLLLLHGTGGTGQDWARVAEHLVDEFSVVAVDLPGHGRSPAPARWTFPEVLGELARIDLDRPAVAGMSLGGILAVHWGALHPECPAAVSFDGHRAPVTDVANYRGLSLDRTIALRSELKASFDAMLSMFPAQQPMFEQISEAMDADDVIPLLQDTRVPTTVVVSTLDLPGTEMYHEILAAFRAGLNDDLAHAASVNDLVHIKALPTTHAMHLEAPREMAELIRQAAVPR
ncbi:alpha/beta fold hydrolase [Glycomyces xiaoerkulensis]|uniref:alpha/beta fold hydrolase n=1 Tax=Glycomyces xiaoerkulensis TaxID=2038139 RepID=UPI000C267DDC|nr:alpha/beta hydrolase [Glycomyces xiaoerkulensis]